VTTASQSRGRRAARPSGDDRQHAILATAERLLAERTFADVSVDDLAKGAGLSRPTFYFYFPSKEAVLLTLIDPLIQQADSGFNSAMDRLPSDPRRAFREGISIFFTAFDNHPAMARSAAQALSSCPEVRVLWAGFMQKWIEQTTELITAERNRGAAPDTIPALDLATTLNQMNERAMVATLAGEQSAVARERLVETLTHIWITSIYGQPG
jgi:AcrR family transcriptional regulator